MAGMVKRLWCCGAKRFPNEADESDVPNKGHVRVYVGKETISKFEVEANVLNHSLFENLLRLSGEELGFSYQGALRIACEVDTFLYLVHLLRSNNPYAHSMDLSDLVSEASAFASHHQ